MGTPREVREECDEPLLESSFRETSPRRFCYGRIDLLIFQWILIVLLTLAGILFGYSLGYRDDCHQLPPSHIFSPARNAISHKDVTFASGFGVDKTKYQGPPTPERDADWEALYENGVIKIPRWEAKLLPNKTVPLPDEPEWYPVGIDVFHQLHCLNMVRQRVWVSEMPEYEKLVDSMVMEIEHIDHCIDAVRQSVMCSSDIATLPWTWDEDSQEVKAVAGTLHTCRDFDKLSEWAKQHRTGPFNRSIHVVDPLDDL